MNLADKEYYLYRILSGCIRCKIYDNFGKQKVFLIKSPTVYQKYIAEEIYQEYLVDNRMQGLYEEEELYAHLIDIGHWSKEEDEKLEGINKDIETLKTKLYKLIFKSEERKFIRKALLAGKEERDFLIEKKNRYYHLSCTGAASIVKMRYLLGASLFYENGSPVFSSDEKFWLDSGNLIDTIINVYNKNRIDEKTIRELARTEPWRSTWTVRKSTGDKIFHSSSCELSDEQKSLVYWTCLYDNIYENPDCPCEDIIDDDDALDGWLIDQEKNRKKRVTEKNVEDLIPESMKNASEVFIKVDTVEDAKKIEELNDERGKQIKRSRDRAISNKGEVHEANLPDVNKDLRMQIVQKAHSAIKNRSK